MFRAAFLSFLLVLLPVGAFASTVSVGASPDLILRIGDAEARLEVGPRRITGPDVQLDRARARLSGRALGRPADLRWTRDRLDGMVWVAPLHVALERQDDGSVLTGTLGTEPVALTVSPMRISGRLGSCTYSLALAGGSYKGWRDCGGGEVPIQAELRLPSTAANESDGASAALLVLVLAPGAGIAPPPPGVSVTLLRRFGLELAPEQPGSPPGATVSKVVPLSPAAAAGLDPGLVIDRVGREDVTSPAELEAALNRAAPGATILIHGHQPGTGVEQVLALELPGPPQRSQAAGRTLAPPARP